MDQKPETMTEYFSQNNNNEGVTVMPSRFKFNIKIKRK